MRKQFNINQIFFSTQISWYENFRFTRNRTEVQIISNKNLSDI